MDFRHGGNIYEIERVRNISRETIRDYSANINPLGPPDAVKQAVQEGLSRVNRYPDISYRELRDAIARREGVDPEWILPGNGAADVLFQLARALAPSAAAVVSPAFSEYRQACESVGCTVQDVILAPESGFAVSAELVSRIPSGAKLLFLCTPNNPPGQVSSREAGAALAGEMERRSGWMVADESFLDFRSDERERTLIPLCGENPRLIVLKSLTKFYAMAGARIGYAVCSDPFLRERYRRISPPWMVSSFAEQMTLAALTDEEYARSTRQLIAGESRWLYEALAALPEVAAYPPGANFVLFRWTGKADLKEALLERAILVRRCGEFAGLGDDWYRVCVSLREKNLGLVEAMREIH